MSYTCYLGGVLWPTPEKLQVKIKGKNKTMVLLNEGEVNFLRAPSLTELTVPFDLPMLTGTQSPDYTDWSQCDTACLECLTKPDKYRVMR